jgi:hypothetical protein
MRINTKQGSRYKIGETGGCGQRGGDDGSAFYKNIFKIFFLDKNTAAVLGELCPG